MKKISALLGFVVCIVASGCTTGSYTVVGTVHPAVSADKVEYFDPPPKRFEEIAVLDLPVEVIRAHRDEDKLREIELTLRKMAARLGANGLILQNEAFVTYTGRKIPVSEKTRAIWTRKAGHVDALAIYVIEK